MARYAEPKSISIQVLAEVLGLEVRGDTSGSVDSLGSLEEGQANQLSFLSSKKYEKFLVDTKAGAVILKAEFADAFPGTALIADDPYLYYAKASALLDPRPTRQAGVHPSAVVAETATIGEGSSIGANCVIGENVVIGNGCEIYPGVVISEDSSLGDACLIHANVTIYSNVRIGNQVIVHSGTAIGSDGFGFAPGSEGWVKIHQLGGVVIGDRVDIGACTAIDRGAVGDTIIHDGVIIDNQVHIAHNIEIGENTAVAGCVGMAGSSKIGKNCTFAGAVAVNGHIEIADNCHFHGGTIVTKGTDEAGVYASATPMLDIKTWRRAAVRFGQLDDLASRVKRLEKVNKAED
ncbi:MAG: UDP-3-O-(3-hydroxymyristoyl)glucosamine N-acyltransferase [Agarilytica sp.]